MRDVIVVGGGLAGISASRELTSKGKSATVLEARDRLGGRSWSDVRFGKIVEMGGNFVHWTQPFLWREARRHGLRIKKGLEPEVIYWITGGEVRSNSPEEFMKLLRPGMDALVGDALEHFPYPYDVYTNDISEVDQETLASRIGRLPVTQEERDLIGSINAFGYTAPESQSISQLLRLTSIYSGNWETMFMAGDTWRLEDGTTSLVQAIAGESTAEFRLSSPVASVEDLGDSVRVTTNSGEEHLGRAAIIAVPINAMSTINFISGLPKPAQELFAAGHSNRGFKVWAKARGEVQPFRALVANGQGSLNLIMSEYRVGDDTLIVAFGNIDSKLSITDLEGIEKEIRQFIPDIEILEIDGHDWSADTYSQGTWVMMDKGQLSRCAPALRHPHGRLWFAGGDIADGFPSWMDGAIESGTLAAGSVVKALS
jgi:monoamine oxidase